MSSVKENEICDKSIILIKKNIILQTEQCNDELQKIINCLTNKLIKIRINRGGCFFFIKYSVLGIKNRRTNIIIKLLNQQQEEFFKIIKTCKDVLYEESIQNIIKTLIHDKVLLSRINKNTVSRTVTVYDLRIPLMLIMNGVEFLHFSIGEILDNAQQNLVSMIKSNCNILFMLCNDITDIEKIEKGILTLNYSTVDISKCIRSCTKFIKNSENIKFIINLKHGISNLIGDYMRIQQIIYNLINNSVKFGSTEITIGTRILESRMLEISIKDNSVGISPDLQKELFNPFRLNDKIEFDSNEQLNQGSGLFLSIILRIITLMNGDISLISDIGTGCIFLIKIPINGENGNNSRNNSRNDNINDNINGNINGTLKIK